jgi:polyhydroxyalkanoate synthesis repressor PhaR
MARIIKKYANRRLYDTESSCYITLDDLKELIVSGVSIEVQEAKTQKDISREVLLQLVAEQESLGRPILNEAILIALIRFYDHPMQKLASNYLETALGLLQDQRAQLSEQMQGLMESPADLVSQLTRQNLEWLTSLQKTLMSAMSPANLDPQDEQNKEPS